ncbi:ADP-ribosylation factor family-domain-containing protein [Pavlovales sp. CCMP2436]|nr:ADP-ribosylation factor family-domain-containing protein [Pavlovales sp. CCMP2436]|mmetsp:Transcript_233/g.627  ORF Transcript_233/g.627 Transcript_233/m.627 type:complete len:185 (+) Transcript_233:89-643(+)
MGQSSSVAKPPRILVVGLDGSGKTCLLRRLAGQEIALLPPTHGYQVVRVAYAGHGCELVDVGGSEELRRYWSLYFDGLAGIVFVLDACDKRRLEEAGVELNRLLQEPKLTRVPTLILANKQDLLDVLRSQKIVDALNLGAVRDREWHVQECSALDRRGINEGFSWVLGQATRRLKPARAELEST